MATINFLYRSIKKEATLNIRLLFRHNNTDHVIGGSTNIKTTKLFWNDIVIKSPQEYRVSFDES